MSRPCGYPLVDGGACAHRIADPNRADCGRHHEAALDVADQPFIRGANDPGECCLVQRSDTAWECLVHQGPEWEAARALGADNSLPCRIPVPQGAKRALAQDPNTAPSTLSMLIWDTTKVVSELAVRNRSMPLGVLRRLLDERDETLDMLVASSSAWPAQTLEAMAYHPRPAVRAGVAANPNTLERLLRTLHDAATGKIMVGLWQNPNLPPDLLAMNATSAWPSTRINAAAHASTPKKALYQLVLTEDNPAVIKQAVGNPSLSTQDLEAMLQQAGSETIRQNIRSEIRRRASKAPSDATYPYVRATGERSA